MKFIEPHRMPEANIACELYHQLKLLDIQCFMEYKVSNARFDMVIIKGDNIVAVVEVKSKLKTNGFNYNTKQLSKYKRIIGDIPIIGICYMKDIALTVDAILGIVGKQALSQAI